MTTLHSNLIARPETDPRPRRWSAEEFLRLAGDGYFDGERVELIDGEVLTMSPIRNAHAAAVSRLTTLLAALPADRYWVRVQATLSLNGNFPDPDIAIVAGPVTSEGDYPTTALMVIEVSDTTLRLDRGKKSTIYAGAGIPEYWIVNINTQQIEVYRSPAPATGGQEASYEQSTFSGRSESAAPLFAPSLAIAVQAVFS